MLTFSQNCLRRDTRLHTVDVPGQPRALDRSVLIYTMQAAYACGFFSQAERAGYAFDPGLSEAEFLDRDRSSSGATGGEHRVTPLDNFLALLHDECPAVLVAVLVASTRLTAAERTASGLVPAFATLLGHEETTVRTAAARLMLHVTPAEQAMTHKLSDALSILLSDKDDVVSRRMVASRFPMLYAPERVLRVDVIKELLEDSVPLIRGSAAVQVFPPSPLTC